MKNRTQLTLIFLITFCSFFFNSCGASHGGRNCDCPTFGNIQNEEIKLLASCSVELAFYLD